MSSYLYLYGLVPHGAPLPGGGLAGVEDGVVELIPFDGFDAVVSRVSDEFSPESLERRTRELSWVGAHGVAHERVVAWFVDHCGILPVPVFTLYSSDEALATEAAVRRDAVVETLQRFAGVREWDLKVSYTESELEAHAAELSEDVAQLDARIAEATPGKRFLLERKRADVVKAEVLRAARREADALLALAGGHAERVRTLPLLQKSDALPVVLNAALLVAKEREEALRDALAREAERVSGLGIALLFSGPWAPYRFLAQEEAVA